MLRRTRPTCRGWRRIPSGRRPTILLQNDKCIHFVEVFDERSQAEKFGQEAQSTLATGGASTLAPGGAAEIAAITKEESEVEVTSEVASGNTSDNEEKKDGEIKKEPATDSEGTKTKEKKGLGRWQCMG